MRDRFVVFMLKPSGLRFRVEKLTSDGWTLMGWAGSSAAAESLALNGLGGACRILVCDQWEHRRAAKSAAAERRIVA